MKEELLQYYDYISRLAEIKCSSREDAEDLVSETFLAAYTYLNNGGSIEYPKTWLYNTLTHKLNNHLRKKYNYGITVDYDTLDNLIADEQNIDEDKEEEAAQLRRELIYLSHITREVLIRYYYNGSSVSDIAEQLCIPEGTVKSRLSAGRDKIKKGLTTMVEKKNNIPGILNLSWGGSDGPNHEPMSLVDGDKIAQNILILAYEKPLHMNEIAEAIGIPTAYIEPVVERLTDGELMIKTSGGKYYTDFIIYSPDDFIKKFDAQKKFVDKNFDKFWSIVSKHLDNIKESNIYKSFTSHQQRKLERYVVLKILQDFVLKLSDDKCHIDPPRRDGGRWTAMAWAFPGGYNDKEYTELMQYTILGGHRRNQTDADFDGSYRISLLEFDTALYDNPHRFRTCGFDCYFKEINSLLWCIQRDIPVDKAKISNKMIESIDNLIKHTGLIDRKDGKLFVDIPVIDKAGFREIESCICAAFGDLVDTLGDEYKDYLKNNKVDIPKHITSIKEVHRYLPAYNYIVMLIVCTAYEKGLHLADVDYCCPPAVLVYEQK